VPGPAPVTILTSGIGLGVYIPALLIARQMRALGAAAEVETLESFYTTLGRAGHERHQQAFHKDFALALLGHRMARGVDGSLDEPRLAELLARWAGESRRSFVVWSGFWLPILARYQARVGEPLHIDCCRIDAVVSASFRPYRSLEAGGTEIWLWNWQEKRLVYEIAVDERPPLGFAERRHRLVVHGGGWGLGRYRQVQSELAATPWQLDTVVHEPAEAAGARPGDRWFMVDPAWRTWQREPNGHGFPPFAELGHAAVSDERYPHALYEVIRHAKAIVSKPGGGTLIDSLSSATPVILLPPYGDAEARNGAVWEHLGFGIAYEKWRESGESEALLTALHENLLRARGRGIDYPRFCVERLRRGAWA
jgi:hypothetical protein